MEGMLVGICSLNERTSEVYASIYLIDINNMLAKLQNRKAQMQAMEREGGLFLLKDFLLRTREEKQKVGYTDCKC